MLIMSISFISKKKKEANTLDSKQFRIIPELVDSKWLSPYLKGR
jgi:hypothetical protein